MDRTAQYRTQTWLALAIQAVLFLAVAACVCRGLASFMDDVASKLTPTTAAKA